jgi:hypothetical protein
MFLQSNRTARRTHAPVPNSYVHVHSTWAALITASGLDCRDCSLTFSRAEKPARPGQFLIAPQKKTPASRHVPTIVAPVPVDRADCVPPILRG